MRLLVVGGRLQGTEAVYLAGKAGIETLLVDRVPDTPATGLADAHYVLDIAADEGHARSLARSCDAILPACEDLATLTWLTDRAPAWDVPLLFDLAAYRVTRSKRASWRLFDRLGVARPAHWPDCGFPVVVKPDAASGSEGVTVARNEGDMVAARAALAAAGHASVVEAFVAGPSLSIEVLAWGGAVAPMQVTGLEFDAGYDCKRVLAPVGRRVTGDAAASCRDAEPGVLSGHGFAEWDWERSLEPFTAEVLADVGVRVARDLGLHGVMDVEVLLRDGVPIVLEIDARLPSQTPSAVFWSSGANLVALLVETARKGAPPALDCVPRRACVYQHVRAADGRLEVVGEHALATARPLRCLEGAPGADEVLTDRGASSRSWVATLISTGASLDEARGRGVRAIEALAAESGLAVVPDLGLGMRSAAIP